LPASSSWLLVITLSPGALCCSRLSAFPLSIQLDNIPPTQSAITFCTPGSILDQHPQALTRFSLTSPSSKSFFTRKRLFDLLVLHFRFCIPRFHHCIRDTPTSTSISLRRIARTPQKEKGTQKHKKNAAHIHITSHHTQFTCEADSLQRLVMPACRDGERAEEARGWSDDWSSGARWREHSCVEAGVVWWVVYVCMYVENYAFENQLGSCVCCVSV
jgi:hypothetical protein